MKTFKIELTNKDFYDMILNRVLDDIDWDRMNTEERKQFKKTLEEGINNQLSKKNYVNFLKRYLLDMYEESEMDEFQYLMDKLVNDANKRIAIEDEIEREKKAKEVDDKKERAEYARLRRKYGKAD